MHRDGVSFLKIRKFFYFKNTNYINSNDSKKVSFAAKNRVFFFDSCQHNFIFRNKKNFRFWTNYFIPDFLCNSLNNTKDYFKLKQVNHAYFSQW